MFSAAQELIFTRSPGCLHDDPVCWNEVDAWIEAARVAHTMFHNRLGLMGHYYGGMLDIYSDTTLQCATFGGHLEIVEVDELAALRREVSATQIKERVAQVQKSFRRASRLFAGRTGARRENFRRARPAGEGTRSRLARLLLHAAPATRKTRTPSARSFWAIHC